MGAEQSSVTIHVIVAGEETAFGFRPPRRPVSRSSNAASMLWRFSRTCRTYWGEVSRPAFVAFRLDCNISELSEECFGLWMLG